MHISKIFEAAYVGDVTCTCKNVHSTVFQIQEPELVRVENGTC